MYVVFWQLHYYDEMYEADKQLKKNPGNKDFQRSKEKFELVSHAFNTCHRGTYR